MFNLKKNSPHYCRELQDHLYYCFPVWRADAIDDTVVAAWRGERKHEENPHKPSPPRFHVNIRREITSHRIPKQAFFSFSPCFSPSGKRSAIKKRLFA
jgi:hypothetical protein